MIISLLRYFQFSFIFALYLIHENVVYSVYQWFLWWWFECFKIERFQWFAMIGFVTIWKLQVSGSSWPDCGTVCICDPQENQIECWKGHLHICGQCPSSYRSEFVSNELFILCWGENCVHVHFWVMWGKVLACSVG